MATVDMSATRGLAGVSDAPTAIRSRLARSIGTLFLRWREGWEAAAEMDRRVREVKWEAESTAIPGERLGVASGGTYRRAGVLPGCGSEARGCVGRAFGPQGEWRKLMVRGGEDAASAAMAAERSEL